MDWCLDAEMLSFCIIIFRSPIGPFNSPGSLCAPPPPPFRGRDRTGHAIGEFGGNGARWRLSDKNSKLAPGPLLTVTSTPTAQDYENLFFSPDEFNSRRLHHPPSGTDVRRFRTEDGVRSTMRRMDDAPTGMEPEGPLPSTVTKSWPCASTLPASKSRFNPSPGPSAWVSSPIMDLWHLQPAGCRLGLLTRRLCLLEPASGQTRSRQVKPKYQPVLMHLPTPIQTNPKRRPSPSTRGAKYL